MNTQKPDFCDKRIVFFGKSPLFTVFSLVFIRAMVTLSPLIAKGNE